MADFDLGAGIVVANLEDMRVGLDTDNSLGRYRPWSRRIGLGVHLRSIDLLEIIHLRLQSKS